MTDKAVWDQPIPVPVETIQYVDPGVQKKLPPGTQTHGIAASGSSYWARTARIDATNAAGEPTPFFIKVLQFPIAQAMVSAEFEAMRDLYTLAPSIIAEPIAHGSYENVPNTWFYICRFQELTGDLPPPDILVPNLIDLHRRTARPGVQFGSATITYGGRKPQVFPPSDSWEKSFTGALGHCFDEEERTHGPDEEMQQLRNKIIGQVIPRLLRPLETEGRKIVPTLVHGDLWHGNVSSVKDSQDMVIFDATPVYAHNEYELSPWWVPREKLGKPYIDAYRNDYAPSEPVEDFEDRGHLYSLRFDLHGSSLYEGKTMLRRAAIDTMRALVAKHPLGYEGYLSEQAAKGDATHDTLA